MRVPTVLLAGMLAMNACGGESSDANVSGGTGGTAGRSATRQEACEKVYDLFCQLNEKCVPEANEYFYPSESACETSKVKECTADLAVAVDATIAEIDACRKLVEKLTCKQYLYSRNPPECEFYYLHKADGETCEYDTDCESLNCPWDTSGSCAVCRPGLREGASCQSGADCGYGTTCDAGVCKTVSGLGEPCSDTRVCFGGLTCAGGTCTRGSAPEGGTCMQDADCAPDLLCDAGACIRPQLRKLGESCDALGDYCEYGTVCPLVAPYVCINRIPDGQSCDALSIFNCAPDALCLNGQCTVLSDLQCR